MVSPFSRGLISTVASINPLTRIADFTRSLSRLHQASRRRFVDDDEIDREFDAVCASIWGYTIDDISDELFSPADHAFLDTLDEAQARIFAAQAGYDLVDDAGTHGLVGLLLDDPGREARPAHAGEPRRCTRRDRGEISHGANVIGVIVGR